MNESSRSATAERERQVRDLHEADERLALVNVPADEAAVGGEMQAEEQLHASEAMLRRAESMARIGNWEWDVWTNEVRWSDGALRILGLAAPSETLERCLSLVHPEDRDPLQRAVEGSFRGNAPLSLDFRVVRPEGTIIWLHGEGEVVRDEAGRPCRMFGTIQDVTDRRRLDEQFRDVNERILIAGVRQQEAAERAEDLAQREHEARLAAEEAQRRLNLLVEAGSVLASSLDYETTLQQVARLAIPGEADWCVVDLLTEGEIRWGVAIAHADPAKEALLRELGDHVASYAERFPLYAKFLRGSGPVLVREIDETVLAQMAGDAESRRVFQQLGPRSLVAVHLVVRGRTLGAVRFLISESERRYSPEDVPLFEELARHAAMAIDSAQLYREAQEANAAKDRFLAMISHELRNPLSTIVAGADLLRKMLPDEERARRTVDAVERAAKLQTRLVEDLLDLSRMTRGVLQLRQVPVRLDSVVGAAVQSLQAEAERAQIGLSLDLPAELWVQGDADRLHQVVTNLTSNAIKFTPPAGRVSVEVRQCGSVGEAAALAAEPDSHTLIPPRSRTARVVVEDTGIGIDAALLPHVFGMFQQGDASGKRKSGLGIGLALVKGLVEAHGGRVWAESAGMGSGSRFIVELPLLDGPPGGRG